MRRLRAAAAAFCGTCLAAATSFAQVAPASPEKIPVGDWQLVPLVEVRTRAEYRHAPVDVGGAPVTAAGTPSSTSLVNDTFTALERSRLGLGVERGPLRAQLTLEDARAWGSVPPSAGLPATPSPGQVGAYEAYIEARTSDPRPSFLRLGRQAVTWGEGRLVGAADWSPAGRSLDALRGRFARGGWQLEVLGAVLEARHPLGAELDDTAGPATGGSELFGANLSWTLDPLLKVELTGLARLTQHGASPPPAAASRFAAALASGETYVGSLLVSGEGRGWKYGAEGAYEIGRATSLFDDRRAFAVAAHVSRTFDSLLLSPTLRLTGSYASGDDGKATYKQFDPLLPDVHTWQGAMDIFAWSNELEASARLTVVPVTDTTLSAEYRFAELAQASGDWLNGYLGVVGTAPANGSAALGHEIDGVFTWHPWPALGLLAGYSAFVLGDGARAILASPNVGRGTLQPTGTFTPVPLSHLAYLQATLIIP